MSDSNLENPDHKQPLAADFEPLKVKEMDNMGHKTKSRSGFQWFLLLLLVVAFAGIGYLALQFQHLSGDFMKASSFQLNQQKQNQTNEGLQERLTAADSLLKEQQSSIESLNAELKNLKAQIAGISGVNRVDWLVDELQHLTRLAHQRLVLSHDANGAIALLKAADQVVIEMRQSSALPIRQAIAADLLELRLVNEVDLEGAYIRLDTLASKIETLHFNKPDYASQVVLVQNELESKEYSNLAIEDQIGSAFTHILNKLQPYLYRSFRIDADVKPVLSGDEREFLSRNMLMTIEEAQLALLRREPESYRLSLEQSEKWIKQYYDVHDPMTTSVLSLIEELKSYRLNPEMPKIDATLSSVKTFAEQWQQEKINKPKLRRSLAQ